jgi:hypothetical protein
MVAAPRGPTLPCPTCRGSGDDPSAAAMACLTCRGRGWLEDLPRAVLVRLPEPLRVPSISLKERGNHE